MKSGARRSRLVIALFVAAAVLAAGAHAGGSTASNGCTAEATKGLLRAFVRDYGSGRIAAVDRLWAPAPRFKWYSTGAPGARLGARAYDRGTLAAYFRARARAHERIRFTELHAGYDPKRNIVNFSGKLVRSADDLSPTPHDFKGAADCGAAGPSLIVWSM